MALLSVAAMHGLIKHSRMLVDRCAKNNEVCVRLPTPYFLLLHQLSELMLEGYRCVPNGGRIRNNASHFPDHRSPGCHLSCVYTLRLLGPISYLDACYIHTKVTKCIREKFPLYYCG